MSYYVASTSKPFSGPEWCKSDEHWDWENERCAPGLCPPGSHYDANVGCIEDGPAEPSSEPSEEPSSPSSGGGSSGGGSRSGAYYASAPSSGMGAGPILAGLVTLGVIGWWFYGRVG